MQKRTAFTDALVKRFVRASRIPPVHSPRIPPLSKLGWRESGEALNAFAASHGRVRHSVGPAPGLWVRRGQKIARPTIVGRSDTLSRSERERAGVRGPFNLTLRRLPPLSFGWLFLLLAFFASSTQAGVREVGGIGLTVGNLDRELMFYTNTLPFELVSISEGSGLEQDVLLGLNSVRLRVATLKLGDERITLTEHVGAKGRPIPADSQSYDHWFQHIAIVVRDMDQAYGQLRQHKVKHVSTAPQTLPAWNKGAAGIKAFYFRDPEDHVLEIIWFPPGKGDPKWHLPHPS